jgi:hypothetical protein
MFGAEPETAFNPRLTETHQESVNQRGELMFHWAGAEQALLQKLA